jgi:hypothetical protein
VVGGYALAAYGHPRYTGDLDFWVGTQTANADKLLVALQQFGRISGLLGGTKTWPTWRLWSA